MHLHTQTDKEVPKMETLRFVNEKINGIVWGPYMLLLLIGVGIFYTVKLKGFQLFGFRVWWNKTAMSVFRKQHSENNTAGISSLQAMSTALAGSVGTGNIVGVASAIAMGGAGAVFWMWIAAFFGMATVFAENVLGVRYRIRKNGKYVGGPMYYIEKGLGCKWLAVIFAVICTAASLGMGNMTQSNSVAGALKSGFGVPVEISGIILSVLVGIIIFGGISRIAHLTEKLVPVMTVLFVIGVLVVILCHITAIPSALLCIISEAFDLKSAAGGFMGYGMSLAIKYGVSRGVFSNEAGLGSSPIVHAAAETDSPYTQGMWGIFQVFIDTIVLCTLMALAILTSGIDYTGMDGITLSTQAFESVLGKLGSMFVSLSIILFAFGTLVSWSYYGEKSLEYLTGGRFIRLYRVIYAAITYFGCVMGISLVWELSDTLNGLMALPNLIALILLSDKVQYRQFCPARSKRMLRQKSARLAQK